MIHTYTCIICGRSVNLEGERPDRIILRCQDCKTMTIHEKGEKNVGK